MGEFDGMGVESGSGGRGGGGSCAGGGGGGECLDGDRKRKGDGTGCEGGTFSSSELSEEEARLLDSLLALDSRRKLSMSVSLIGDLEHLLSLA